MRWVKKTLKIFTPVLKEEFTPELFQWVSLLSQFV